VHDGLARTAQRARRILHQRVFPAVVGPSVPFEVRASAPLADPCSLDEAATLDTAPFTVPGPWGPAWTTTWFRLDGRIPDAWAGATVVAAIDLGFSGRSDGFQAEGLVYRDGVLRHAVQPDRRTVVLERPAARGEAVHLLLEAAATPIMSDDPTDTQYRPTVMGDRATAPASPCYVLRHADLAVWNDEVHGLAVELHAALDLLLDLAVDDPLRPRLALAIDDALGALDLDDVVASAPAARAALAPIFAVPSAPGSHRIVAVGHAHLDTAWLWPVREARRKAVRTFANAVDLLERFPEHRFAHSQAQHYAWVEADQPALFARVRELVADGRWEPVGGMWVEADLNLTGGESLVRQLVHGQRAFTRWFGRPCPGAFLPDDFGYPATLPQLLAAAGCDWFFTQKLSWNETNRFPHHTFWWEGLDGTRVFTHFSPVDTYNALNTPAQLRYAARRFADHGRASVSLVCFGHGDGGGGPTATMVERVRLLGDTQAVPPTTIGTVDGFFREAMADSGERAPVWVGEMYLEKHRGTYTSQVATKQGNLACERLLREAELWSATAGTWPGEHLEELWRRVLVQQFHDILPGSAIAWAHRDAEAVHAEVAVAAEGLVAGAFAGPDRHGPSTEVTVANPAPFPVDEVVIVASPVPLPDGPLVAVDTDGARRTVQRLPDGRLALAVCVPALGTEVLRFEPGEGGQLSHPAVQVDLDGEAGSFDNGTLFVAWDGTGTLTSLVHVPTGRESLPPGQPANRLVVRQDQPAEYDAWDIDEPDTRGPGLPLDTVECAQVVAAGPLVAVLRVDRRWGRSSFTQEIVLRAGATRVDLAVDVDWQESERRLQVVVPVDVLAREVTCGVQLGHVSRPRHENTSWDAARFEVVAHRYVHAGEHGFGVALLAAGPHGYDVRGAALRMTLLRSPRYPDPTCDRGRHRLEYAIRPGDDPVAGGQLEAEAHRMGHPVRLVAGGVVWEPVVTHDLAGVVVEAVKRADDGSGDLVVRLWESSGGRTAGSLHVAGPPAAAAFSCDLLEQPHAELVLAGGAIQLALRPFEVVTVRVRSAR
jgi:alpha-mannosidase